jgi:hypothetical protein
MQLNKFDPITREFSQSISAPINPKQPDNYLMVSNTTPDSLPSLSANQTALRSTDNTQWEIVADYRGTVWNKETKEQIQITDLGSLDKTLTELKPSEFDQWNDEKWVIDKSAQLEHDKIEAINKVKGFAIGCRRKIAGDADHLETAEWSEKRLRALRISNDEVLPGDIEKIETEALYRGKGETAEMLADKILDKAARYENASIIITGMTAAAFESVEKAVTVEELNSLLVSLKDKADAELAKL